MSARIGAFVIVLEKDVDGERAQKIKNLLGIINGVASVQPHEGDPLDIAIAQARAKFELQTQLWEIVK